jgi:glycosyltransferase involved in cell wall biosynthesis
MKKAPLFSICIPVYQGAGFIKKAISSIQSQTLDDWELIIVDNASTDSTWEIIQVEVIQDSRIRAFRNLSNLGAAANLNECLRHVQGAWIGFLAADDIYMPDAFSEIFQAVQDSETFLWAHAHYSVYPEGRKDLIKPFDEALRLPMGKLAEIFYLRGNLFGEISCYFVRSRALERMQGLLGEDRSTADVDFWMRIAFANPESFFRYSPAVLTETSIHEASESSQYNKSGENWVDFFSFMEDFSAYCWPLSIRCRQACRAFYCLLRYGWRFTPEQRFAALRSTANILCRVMLPSQKHAIN